SGMGVDAGSAGARSTRSKDYPLLRRGFKPDRVRFWLAERRGNGWPSRCPGATVNGGLGMNPAGTLQPDETHAVLSGALRELEGVGARLEGWTEDDTFTRFGIFANGSPAKLVPSRAPSMPWSAMHRHFPRRRPSSMATSALPISSGGRATSSCWISTNAR